MTPVPPPPPQGTPRPLPPPRPQLSTLEELKIARVDLADSSVLDRPQRDINALIIYNLRELKSQTSERDVALFTELSTIKVNGQKAAGKSDASAFWGRFMSLAFTSLTLLGAFGAELGRTDQKGFGAALVALSAALAKFGPTLMKLASGGAPPPPESSAPPPSHT